MSKGSVSRKLLGCQKMRSRQGMRLSSNLLSKRTQTILHEQLHRAGRTARRSTDRLSRRVALSVLPVHATTADSVRQVPETLQLKLNLLPKHLLPRRRTQTLSTTKAEHSCSTYYLQSEIQRRLDKRFHRQSCHQTMNVNKKHFFKLKTFFGTWFLFILSPASFTL